MIYTTSVDLGVAGDVEVDVDVDTDYLLEDIDQEELIEWLDLSDEDNLQYIVEGANLVELAGVLLEPGNLNRTERLLREMMLYDLNAFASIIERLQNSIGG